MNNGTTADVRLLNLERELDAIETRIRKCPHVDQGRLAGECLTLEAEIGEAPARSFEGVAVKLRRTLTMIREGRGDLTDAPVRSALAAVDRLREEPTLADVLAAQREMAHALANVRQAVDIIANAVRVLVNDRPAGG